jgi:hypothetical protein
MSSPLKREKLKSAALCGLVALNALLLVVLVMRHAPENQAKAAGRPVGDVIAVPASFAGINDGIVLLYDPQNQRLGAVGVDSSAANPSVQPMRPLDLGPLLNSVPNVRGH